jgi:hypothetical protein
VGYDRYMAGAKMVICVGAAWVDGMKNARLTRPIEPEAERTSSGPRFVRFGAAIEATPPPQAQLLEELLPLSPSPLQSALPETTGPVCGPTKTRSRLADRGRSHPKILWLGIGSWMLFCAAFFVSLLPSQDRTAYDHGAHIRSAEIRKQATSGVVLQGAGRSQTESMPTTDEVLPSDGQEAASAVRPPLDASSARPEAADARLREADLASGADDRVPKFPPLPRLKPLIDLRGSPTPHSGASPPGGGPN